MVADTSDSTQFTTVRIRKVNDSDIEEEESDSEGKEEDSESETKEEESQAIVTTTEVLSVGNWVIVNYDGEEFPGEITSCENDIEVSVMHRSSNKFWKWPKPIDKICYERKDVIKIINPPKVAGHRGQYVFED